ncbi:MAG: YkvA family protein [Myxococcota bacterium]
MSDSQQTFLDTFPTWLRNLGEDAEALARCLDDARLPRAARESVAGGLNYLFKSLDLIPDGIDDIGYLDDAFVLRVAAELATREDISDLSPETLRGLNRLAEEADLIRQFLDEDFERLETYVKGLRKGAARGRAVDDILDDDGTRSDFLNDVETFAKGYQAPSFGREEKNLIKLKAFFDAKLPK